MKILGRAEQVVPLVKGPRVLHVGCAAHAPAPGDPSWLHGLLCKYFPDTVGIDLRPDLIEQLQNAGFRNLYVANAETFELDRQFDTIVAGDVLEHLSNPGAFLTQARKHLAPGGEIIVTTPFPFALLPLGFAFFRYPRTCWNVEHTCWFCPQTFSELSRRSGLRILRQDLIGTYTLDDSSTLYRTSVWTLRVAGSLIPKRLRCNTMLFVLSRSECGDEAPYRKDVISTQH
jgi:SAM-dependent methyltransferase